VLDFFCGSGTTLVAAQELHRNWIGIDKSEQAIKTTKEKLQSIPQTLFDTIDYSYMEVISTQKAVEHTEESECKKIRQYA
jgi:adenine-specific DNA-methyltransferase